MIEVYIQLRDHPIYLAMFNYTNGARECSTVQLLQEELPVLFRNATRNGLIEDGDPWKPNVILGLVTTQILTHQTGPWKVILMRDKKVMFTLEYAVPLLESETEVGKETPRISRYIRTPVI